MGAGISLPELRFRKFGHLKNGSQRFLFESDPEESVNLISIKNRIQSMIFSCYAQDSGYVTSWRLGYINFQVFLELHPLDLINGLIWPPKLPAERWKIFLGSVKVN